MVKQFSGWRPFRRIMNKTALNELSWDLRHICWECVLGRASAANAVDDLYSFEMVPQRFSTQHLHHSTSKTPAHTEQRPVDYKVSQWIQS